MRFFQIFKSVGIGVALCLMILLSSSAARAQQSDALAGKWNMVSSTDDGNQIPWTLSITYVDGKYGASASTDSGENPVKDLKVEGKTVHFRVPYQGQDYDIDLKLVGEKLAGSWSGNGGSGDTKGEKASAPTK
ncbi:MAG: hypothetical protein JO097_13100 [Acidobacteriaceae bacterium]|nr:hypothetical protein [Acidobacteriaceae bacterium]MBV9293968.1 hypothetical protein [Acidobacteriaceae bacterium]MBV9765686.1 hypothetical protein [Acidobacteriaceae bacterium]